MSDHQFELLILMLAPQFISHTVAIVQTLMDSIRPKDGRGDRT